MSTKEPTYDDAQVAEKAPEAPAHGDAATDQDRRGQHPAHHLRDGGDRRRVGGRRPGDPWLGSAELTSGTRAAGATIRGRRLPPAEGIT